MIGDMTQQLAVARSIYGDALSPANIGALLIARQVVGIRRMGETIDINGLDQVVSSSDSLRSFPHILHCPSSLGHAADLNDTYQTMISTNDIGDVRRYVFGLYNKFSSVALSMRLYRLFELRNDPVNIDHAALNRYRMRFERYGDGACRKILSTLRRAAAVPMSHHESELVCLVSQMLMEGEPAYDIVDFVDRELERVDEAERDEWRIVSDIVEIIHPKPKPDDPVVLTMLELAQSEVAELLDNRRTGFAFPN